jgi:hypothetical protein
MCSVVPEFEEGGYGGGVGWCGSVVGFGGWEQEQVNRKRTRRSVHSADELKESTRIGHEVRCTCSACSLAPVPVALPCTANLANLSLPLLPLPSTADLILTSLFTPPRPTCSVLSSSHKMSPPPSYSLTSPNHSFPCTPTLTLLVTPCATPKNLVRKTHSPTMSQIIKSCIMISNTCVHPFSCCCIHLCTFDHPAVPFWC